MRHALIGAALGVLLVYVGSLIPFRILRWPVLALGVVFVLVMTSYVLVALWQGLAGYLQPHLKAAAGHVRQDPQLGTLTRDVRAHCWGATLTRRNRTITIVLRGDGEPDPRLLADARDLVARLDTLQARAREYLEREAIQETQEDGEMASEIRALEISSITFSSADPPGHAVIDFEGPEEMRYWYCNYANGELSGLRFDT